MTEKRHIPVLLREVVESINPLEGALVIDGTFGAGGYSRAFLAQGATVVALDRDPNAIRDGRALAEEFHGQLQLVETTFSKLDHVSAAAPDVVVLDIGVSSMQLDEGARGFSFQKDGPLDMRMSGQGFSAADVVNSFKANELSRIFHVMGEEKNSGRIARMIEMKREKKPFQTTLELADAIEGLVGRKPGERIHPATRVFQALRIYVNDELGELIRALFAAEKALKTGGRLAVVTFHSLEDRIVKRFLAERSQQSAGSRHLPAAEVALPSFSLLFKGAKEATEEEATQNPRARSAKLRVGVRTANPAHLPDAGLFSVPAVKVFGSNRS